MDLLSTNTPIPSSLYSINASQNEDQNKKILRDTPVLRFQEWEQQKARVTTETLKRKKLTKKKLKKERKAKRRHQNTNKKINSELPRSENRNHNYEANNKNPRSAKRQKFSLTSTHNALTPPDKPIPLNNNLRHIPRTSRSPSSLIKSAPTAEYQK